MIIVKYFSGRKNEFKVDLATTKVEDLRELCTVEINENLMFIHKGVKFWDETKTLEEYDVKSGDIIYIILKLSEQKKTQNNENNVSTTTTTREKKEENDKECFNLDIVTLAGRKFPILVNLSTTKVEDVFRMISDETGIPMDSQRIVFRGIRLEEYSKTLRECGVKKGDILYVVLAL